jgi:hypothetical protein
LGVLTKKVSFGQLDPFIGFMVLGTRLEKGEFLLEKLHIYQLDIVGTIFLKR